jgi:hypothetical protein
MGLLVNLVGRLLSGEGDELWDLREQWSVSLSLKSEPIPAA